MFLLCQTPVVAYVFKSGDMPKAVNVREQTARAGSRSVENGDIDLCTLSAMLA